MRSMLHRAVALLLLLLASATVVAGARRPAAFYAVTSKVAHRLDAAIARSYVVVGSAQTNSAGSKSRFGITGSGNCTNCVPPGPLVEAHARVERRRHDLFRSRFTSIR